MDRSDQFRLIEEAAPRLGFLFEPLKPMAEGGREHDVIYDETSVTDLTRGGTASLAGFSSNSSMKIHPSVGPSTG